VVLWRAGSFPVIAGLVLAAALAGNAAVALNHPGLIEQLDHERQQRQQIVLFLIHSPARTTLSRLDNGRISPRTNLDTGWTDLARSWDYLLYGVWLVVWAALGVWLGASGPVGNRWRRLAGWSSLGLVLGSVCCLTRLRAEYYWIRAVELEQRGQAAAARDSLGTAIGLFPEYSRLERTWLLAGRLDYLQARATTAEQLFRASQLAFANGQREAELLRTERIRMLFGQSEDTRETWMGELFPGALLTSPPGPSLSQPSRNQPVEGAAISSISPATGAGALPKFPSSPPANPAKTLNQSLELFEELLKQEKSHPMARSLAARVLTDIGLVLYSQKPLFTDSGPDYSAQKLNLTSAQEAWERALQLDESRLDCMFYLGYTQTLIDPTHPELAEGYFEPLLDRVADRLLFADTLNVLADAYFEAGRMAEARQRYAESLDMLNLPQRKNFGAQRGLGGL
jgi:tetratricopeptide (TPR) repeat protein